MGMEQRKTPADGKPSAGEDFKRVIGFGKDSVFSGRRMLTGERLPPQC